MDESGGRTGGLGRHRKEVYEVNIYLEKHMRQVEQWTYTYNYIRRNQALGFLTPLDEHISEGKEIRKPNCHQFPHSIKNLDTFNRESYSYEKC